MAVEAAVRSIEAWMFGLAEGLGNQREEIAALRRSVELLEERSRIHRIRIARLEGTVRVLQRHIPQ